ncbi:DNA (cytosine-5-)-methyltransferase [Akkermansiaceae bacterium]|nr:DNA (cytosine-5-)-methyltransferase [Akkermansiaceae bacterium]
MNVLSLFDGMSCGQIALDRLGVPVENYYAAEIDKHAIDVTKVNYPNTKHLGSVTEWRIWDLESDLDWSKIDLIIAGSPCQGFSFAGKQLAFDDLRSKLFFVFVDILNHCKKFNSDVKFMLENVRMKKEHIDVISNILEVTPVAINSNLVSAQNRYRLYWANWSFRQPEDKKIFWGDVRESGLEKFYYSDAGLQWLARSSRKKGKTLDVWSDKDKAQMVEASHHKNYSNQRFFGICDFPASGEAVAAMRGRRILNGKRVDNRKDITIEQFIEFRYDKKTNCLSTVSKDNVIVPFTLPGRISRDAFFFRYISPVECERLQTVPDNYTETASNSQRYKMLGNGWTVDVITHIFKYMNNEILLGEIY